MSAIRSRKRINVYLSAAILVTAAAVFVGVHVADSGGNALLCQVSEQNAPGGPDGAGGCWPGEWNTGPSGSLSLLDAPPGDNDRYVFDGIVTIDHKIINHSILVRTGTTTITNSEINGQIEVYEPGALNVIDSKIDGGDAYYSTMMGWNYDLTRTEIFGGQQASICSGGCNWVDVYAHSPHYFADQAAHQSAFATTGNMSGELISVEHSTLWCNVPQVSPMGGGCTSDVALQPNFAPVENITIHNNLMPVSATSGYCLTGGYATSAYSEYAPLANHIIVTDNVFGQGDNGMCGNYGTSANWNTVGTGSVWTGNVYTDGSSVNPNS